MLAQRYDVRAAKTAWIALLAGVVAARIGFIARNFSAFREDPWSMLFLWQGGFSWCLGVAATALVIVVTLGRSRAGLALLGATAALASINGAATVLLATEPRPLPSDLVSRGSTGHRSISTGNAVSRWLSTSGRQGVRRAAAKCP